MRPLASGEEVLNINAAEPPPSTAADSALARLREDRRVWGEKPILRALYESWYRRIAKALRQDEAAVVLELGSGPGLSGEFLPGAWLSDIVAAPWLDLSLDASRLPVKSSSLDGLVAFDLLHHMGEPLGLFLEAQRCLRPSGRLILCEPFVSGLSYPVYRWLHSEGLDFSVDPLLPWGGRDKAPFEGNQALPRMLLDPLHPKLVKACPSLRLVSVERLAGPCYPLSGGFTHRAMVPDWLWRAVFRAENILPKPCFRVLGFRMIAVLEKVALNGPTQ